MLKPTKGEAKADFLHRFMSSEDARREHPDEAKRFEAGCSVFEHAATLNEFGNALGYNAERDGAESFGGRHLQAGVVGYPEMKHPLTHKQGISILVEKDVIDQMRQSARGIPVINWAHVRGDVSAWLAEGKADGVVSGSRWNGEDGWEHIDFLVWDKETKANARNGFRLSNAWTEDEIDWTPGVHNGVPYDGRLKAAHYTHLAIVPNPRYEGAVIYANAKGGFKAMFKLFGFGKQEAVELDKDASLEVNGKKYSPLEVVNALAAADAKVTTTAKAGVLGDKDEVEVNGKKYTALEVANAIAALEKSKAAPAPEVKPELAKEKAEEFQNAVTAEAKKLLDKAMEDLKGHAFFNTIDKLAKVRPDSPLEPKKRLTEKDRLAEGRRKYGSRKAA